MRVSIVGSKVLGLGLALACFLAGGPGTARRADAEELKKVAERLLPFAPGGEIHIDDKNGRLTVDAWPRHDVRIQITRVVRAKDRETAEAVMKELQSEIEVNGSRIDVQSRFPRRVESIGIMDLFGRKNTTMQINYYVQVPEESDLWLQTTNGEVHVQGTSGHLEARTTNGAVEVTNVKGNLTLQTTNGEVTVKNVTGQASAHTTNGSVVAELRRLPVSGAVDLQTTNGNVEAYFDRDLKADLDASTTNGHVSIEFPVTANVKRGSRTFHGTIQGGGAKITIQTTNGNVEVRRIGERRH
jgi:DUF4097 and DUF4098 domain-containing protein YvlB